MKVSKVNSRPFPVKGTMMEGLMVNRWFHIVGYSEPSWCSFLLKPCKSILSAVWFLHYLSSCLFLSFAVSFFSLSLSLSLVLFFSVFLPLYPSLCFSFSYPCSLSLRYSFCLTLFLYCFFFCWLSSVTLSLSKDNSRPF